MVISQPPGNNHPYYYRASPTTSIALNASRDTLCSYTCNYNIRVTHRNGAVSIFFTRIRSTEGSCGVLYSFVAPCALFIAWRQNIAKSFCVENLSTLALHTSVGCISLQNASRTALCYATILLSENIPNIWHKSSTKHKEVRPDWNDKNDNANYAPSLSRLEGFYNGSVCHLKKYSDQVRKDLDCELFYSELKTSQPALYLLSSHR